MNHFFCIIYRKKTIFLVMLVFSVCRMNVFPAENLTPAEEAAIQGVMDFRLTLASLDPAIAIERTDAYRKEVMANAESQALSDETILILDTFLALETYNYLYERNQSDPAIRELIVPQVEKIDEWFSTHQDETINKWLYCIAGDAISCSMAFMPKTKAMKRGLQIKEHYLKALEQDENFVYCLMNCGQWFFQAPAIGGGSKSKAKGFFEKAERLASTRAEKYYSKIFLSQFYFDAGNMEECRKLLDAATEIVPESNYIKQIKAVNSVGASLFYYVVHRPEVNRKLAKSDAR